MPAVSIVGMGRIGRVFARAAERAGRAVVPMTRARGSPADAGPVVVAVAEDDLEPAIAPLDAGLGARLCFVQNGLVHEAVARFGDVGRGLLHFNADAAGNVRVLEPSVFGGPTGADLAGLLDAAGIPSRHEPDAERFKVEEIRKLLWSTVPSLLAARRGVPVGALDGAEVEALTRECVAVASAYLGVSCDFGEMLASVCRMQAALPDYRGSARGQRYRNALLVRLGRRLGIPTPLNDALVGPDLPAMAR
jgi:ketopantoate reductase